MTTTSLEMSRKLDAAGFRKDWCPLWFYVGDTLFSVEDEYFRPDIDARAWTLDDLVTALGLDKPWSDVHCKCPSPLNSAWCIYEALEDHGLTPDVLAQVWIDIQGGTP